MFSLRNIFKENKNKKDFQAFIAHTHMLRAWNSLTLIIAFMEIIKIPYADIPLFSATDKAYLAETTALRPFYKYPVRLESFRQVLQDKRKDKTDRKTLVEVLKSQYASRTLPAPLAENIEKLAADNTFTVVTAHQPSLFTGPLYYIYKIISTLSLAKRLNGAYREFHFVPVFISSGEDHDFNEVNHLHLFNKTLVWDSGETGPVGMMKTASLQPVLEELMQTLGDSEPAQRIYQLIAKTHTHPEHYAEAAIAFVHELFKENGLVVLNTNDARLKRLFIPVIEEEIFRQPSLPLVNETIGRLTAVGFPPQATPREINFFYMGEQLRERIVEESGVFKVVNTGLVFTPSEMKAEIETHPERFSPNVIMRPVYQEWILPNLAYVGGGGELAYWLERKTQFERFGVNFPMLVRRNSALWIEAPSVKRMEKLGLSLEELWLDTESLIKIYLKKTAATEFQLNGERQKLEAVFRMVAQKTEPIDPTLVKTVWAEHAKALKSLELLEVRLVRAEKQKHENAIGQIRNLKEKLFPGNGLQERHDNFLPFYLRYGEEFFSVLKNSFDPLEKKFVVVKDSA